MSDNRDEHDDGRSEAKRILEGLLVDDVSGADLSADIKRAMDALEDEPEHSAELVVDSAGRSVVARHTLEEAAEEAEYHADGGALPRQSTPAGGWSRDTAAFVSDLQSVARELSAARFEDGPVVLEVALQGVDG